MLNGGSIAIVDSPALVGVVHPDKLQGNFAELQVGGALPGTLWSRCGRDGRGRALGCCHSRASGWMAFQVQYMEEGLQNYQSEFAILKQEQDALKGSLSVAAGRREGSIMKNRFRNVGLASAQRCRGVVQPVGTRVWVGVGRLPQPTAAVLCCAGVARKTIT
jgi:hypothetical protein